MEVFPLEDAVPGEIGGAPVSQVEQMKSWDDSFAQLEKMLQAACETEGANEDGNFSELSPTLSPPLANRVDQHDLNQNTKRKREDGEDSAAEDEGKTKLFRTEKMLSNELSLKIIESPKESNSSNSVSQLISDSQSSRDDALEKSCYSNMEEECKPFQPCTDQSTEQSTSTSENIFQCAVNNVAENIDTTFLDDGKSLAVPDKSDSYSYLDCKDSSNVSSDEPDKVVVESGSHSLPELHCNISENQRSETFSDVHLNDVVDNSSDKNTNSSETPHDSDNDVKKTDEEKLVPCESSDKDNETASNATAESRGKKEKKDDHTDKNKKDDKKKKKFERCNIRDIKLEDELDAVTLSAQKEEQERIKRLQEAQMRALQERLQIIEVEKEALTQLFSQPNADEPNLFSGNSENESIETSENDDKAKMPIKSETDVILLESSDEDKKTKVQEIPPCVESDENVIDISSSSSEDGGSDSDDSEKKDDDVLVLSDEGESEPDAGPEDPNNSGAHTNDCFNLPDHEGRVLVNVGHPPEDPDIYLAPQIAKVIKPHQIGGIRFLYDNVVENLERYKSSSGFGCILAHSMGLGKTVQVVSFVDVFLRHTPATLVLCIVPINTIQNWKAEFDMWVPSTGSVDSEQTESGEVRPRDYNVYTLNENFKTMAARAALIAEWRSDGGVLLMGYEMYRMLALRKMPKIPVKKGRRLKKQDITVEPETTEQIKKFMDQMYEHIVIPGPDLVICDEGHRIKNSLASTSMALKSIKTRRRVVLTGYPLQNNLLEYWCMVDFVRPNYLGSRAEFCNMFERPISNGQCIDSTPRDRQLMRFRSHVLHSLLVGFVQRRGHSVLRAVLPKKEEHVLLIRMTPIQRKLYKCFVKDLLYVQQATNPLKLFAVCCKIWNHPDILYKLLQEKKAQEDIDLDIDLSTTTAGSSASTALMKRKALNKDQMKCKIFQRPLKSPVSKNPELIVPKSEHVPPQGAQSQMQGTLLPNKSESQNSEQSVAQQNTPPSQEQVQFSELSSQICKEEYTTLHSSAGNQQQQPQNHGYSHQSLTRDCAQNIPFSQAQYSPQSSFCQSNFSPQNNLQHCQNAMKSSAQYSQHQSYPSQSQQQYLNNSTQPQFSHNSFSPGSNPQLFGQQTPSSVQIMQQQQYNMQQPANLEQGFSQASNSDNFHQLSQYPSQVNSQQYSQQASLPQQPYNQTFSQQSSKSQVQFNQEVPNSQFNIQPSSQTVNSQIPFNQQTPQQFNQTNITPYVQQSQQFSPSTPSPQYGQQSQKYEHSSGHLQYPEKTSSGVPQFGDRSSSDQQCHEPNSSQQAPQHSYTDHTLPQQFNQPSPIQSQFCPSPAPQSQFAQRPSVQQNRTQPSFSQSSPIETKPSFSQPSPNPKIHQQPSPQHFSQQASPQFSQQTSPLQTFSQCSPQQQTQYSQHSPPLQPSPTQQQYSLASPTQQAYPASFPQSQPSHQQYVQTPTHQYPQEASPQQGYSQTQYAPQSSSQQYPQHSSPQQQFSHQSGKQTYSQQFNSPYPRQPSPQQHYSSQSRQAPFSVGHQQQQQYPQQPLQPYKSHVTPQYSQQGSHSQFSAVSSQSSNQGQQFSSSSQSYNQQQLPSRSQYGGEQYSMQVSQSKSQPAFSQQASQNVSSPQYTPPTGKPQYSNSNQQPAVSSSFMQPPSPPQPYSQQATGSCPQSMTSKPFQHSFSQQSSQKNSQSSFQPSYQPHMQTMQLPQLHSNAHQNSSKQLPLKGKIKLSAMQQVSEQNIETIPSPKFSQQSFQNSGLDQPVPPPQQNTKSISSSYQSATAVGVKQENFGGENIKDETDAAYPSRCSKPPLRPVKCHTSSSLLPYQGQVQAQDTLKSEGEQVVAMNQESVMTPCRERMDSSINYEWAIPIMKEYILGVLENSHKMMVLFAIIEKTIQKGDKLLVFSQSLSTLDLLEQFLSKIIIPVQPSTSEGNPPEYWCRNKNYFRLDGSTSAQEREKLINEFNKNDNVSLFLLSTRAGCLGINLVGANRIVVMDASWNPCHDAQAVCRIYRYGQKKQCHIYRLVTDNSLEKRIYDRQVNKQGMSDRVVDELNPESNFTWKDVTTLIQDDEDDGPPQELEKFESSYTDEVLKYLVTNMSQSLSKEPFEHESLLLDRKDLKLTKQEKRLAKQSYEMAKRANMINIRTTYTYMPGGGQFIINNKQCQWVGGTTVRVVPGQMGRGTGNRSGTTATPITASPSLMNTLFKQGVMVQKLTIPSTISIPVLTPGAPPVVVPAGQDVLVLRTPKGVYLRLPDGRIIAVQLPPSLLAKTQFRPNVVTHFRPNVKGNNQSGAGRGQSIGIIKQTLQCGGTVRYLGSKNGSGNAAQNSARNSAPEVIDLSDDDEPCAKKSNSADGAEAESDCNEQDQNQNANNKPSNIFQGKQITIRRVSPSMQQNTIQLPSTKEKCDLPLKLQQNQQITIMPINPPGQQSRQKLAPQLAQPVRVQQMLLQPQQGKRKPLPKNTTKVQLSSLALGKSFQGQQITVTPTHPVQLQKGRTPSAIQSFQIPDDAKSPKSPESSVVEGCKRSSPESLIVETTKSTEINNQTVENIDSVEENIDNSTNISHVDQCSLPTKSVPVHMPQATVAAANNLPEAMKSGLNSISEMNQQISNLVNQNLPAASNSPRNLSNSTSQNSPALPISITHNLPPSVSVIPITRAVSDPLPQVSKSANLGTQAPVMSTSFLPLDTSETNLQSHKPMASSAQNLLSKPGANELQMSPDNQFQSLTHQLSSNSHPALQIIDKGSQSQKSGLDQSNIPNSLSLTVPKPSEPVSQTSVKADAHDSHVQMSKNLLHSYGMEKSQNGQVHSDLPFVQQQLTHLSHSSGIHATSVPHTQSQVHSSSSSKKKKTSRQASKKSPLPAHLSTQTNQSQTSESLHQFSHPALSEHLHDRHRFQPFTHSLQNSDFPPFQSYATHKPLLRIQHPQPLHPLQHGQEHSLAPHLSHMSHLYPMSTHMAGNPSLSEIQPQPPRAWPVPQSSMSSFHPFGQSSQYYSSPHESSQFPFQPSSFALPQPTAAHVSQEPSIGLTGLEHVTGSLSSEL